MEPGFTTKWINYLAHFTGTPNDHRPQHLVDLSARLLRNARCTHPPLGGHIHAPRGSLLLQHARALPLPDVVLLCLQVCEVLPPLLPLGGSRIHFDSDGQHVLRLRIRTALPQPLHEARGRPRRCAIHRPLDARSRCWMLQQGGVTSALFAYP